MKRKKQPSAEAYREQLRLAADEIIRLRTMLLIYVRHPTWPGAPPTQNPFDQRQPWYRRIFMRSP